MEMKSFDNSAMVLRNPQGDQGIIVVPGDQPNGGTIQIGPGGMMGSNDYGYGPGSMMGGNGRGGMMGGDEYGLVGGMMGGRGIGQECWGHARLHDFRFRQLPLVSPSMR